jgi:transposase
MNRHIPMSQAGFGGDPDSRMLSWGEGILRCHGETEEVPRGAVGAWVRLVFESGRPIAHVAADLGIHPEALRKRVRQAEADSGRRSDLLTTQERDEIRRLRRENLELRHANEILKAASVFFANPPPLNAPARKPGDRIPRGRDTLEVVGCATTRSRSLSSCMDTASSTTAWGPVLPQGEGWPARRCRSPGRVARPRRPGGESKG